MRVNPIRIGLLVAATLAACWVGMWAGGGLLTGLLAALVLHSFITAATLMRLSDRYSDGYWALTDLTGAVEVIGQRLQDIEERLWSIVEAVQE